MHADIDAIRNLATANATHAEELAAIATKLSTAPTSTAAFGPIGEPFLATLAEAVATEARAVAALRDRASATGAAAYRTALAYDDADNRAGARVSDV